MQGLSSRRSLSSQAYSVACRRHGGIGGAGGEVISISPAVKRVPDSNDKNTGRTEVFCEGSRPAVIGGVRYTAFITDIATISSR